MIELCRVKLAKYKLPKSVIFIDSFVPYISGAGKILKRRLMEDYGEKVTE